MVDEQFVFELGEQPSMCRINDALLALGSAAVKRHVIGLFESGLTRDQVNVILRDEILPAFNTWLRENYFSILRTINDAPARTVN